MRPTPRLFPILLLAMVVMATGLARPGGAQDSIRIVAVVNEDVISVLDLGTRIRMVISSSGLTDTPETRQRVSAQVLDTLIDEALQRQEAKRLGITVPQADIDNAFADIARGNNLTAEEFRRVLNESGVPPSTLVNKLEADIAWATLIRQTVVPQITVSESEIQSELERLRSQPEDVEVLLSEIFLPVDRPEEAGAVLRSAQSIVGQVRGGADFGAVARQVSRATTAQNGGDLDWISIGQLQPEVRQPISGLRVGEISDPVRTKIGFYVFRIRDSRQRAAESSEPEDVEFSLRQIFLPVEPGVTPAQRDQLFNFAWRLRSETQGCGDIDRVQQRYGIPDASELGTMLFSEMTPRLRDVVGPLAVDQGSAPLALNTGFAVVFVCERRRIDPNLPEAAEVRQRLMFRKVDQIAQRYLRDLRRAAITDVRM